MSCILCNWLKRTDEGEHTTEDLALMSLTIGLTLGRMDRSLSHLQLCDEHREKLGGALKLTLSIVEQQLGNKSHPPCN